MGKCRTCGVNNTAHTNLDDQALKPKVGDYSLCAYCGTISRYDSELKLVPLPADGLIKLNDEDPALYDELIRIQKRIFELHA